MNEKSAEINITVKSQDGSVICFKLKRTTTLKKLMDAYCSRHGLDKKVVRFIYDGNKVTETDTPESLRFEDGDEIDAMTEQHGGNFESLK